MLRLYAIYKIGVLFLFFFLGVWQERIPNRITHKSLVCGFDHHVIGEDLVDAHIVSPASWLRGSMLAYNWPAI